MSWEGPGLLHPRQLCPLPRTSPRWAAHGPGACFLASRANSCKLLPDEAAWMQAPLPVILADNCTPLLRSFLCPSAGTAWLGRPCTHLGCPRCGQQVKTARLCRHTGWCGLRGGIGDSWEDRRVQVKQKQPGLALGVSKARLTLGSCGNRVYLLPGHLGTRPPFPRSHLLQHFPSVPHCRKGRGYQAEKERSKTKIWWEWGERALHGSQVPYPSLRHTSKVQKSNSKSSN